MNLGLPIVVDITISLIFVYFTLSLLSSEIQELLKTLLQWRAVHLKKSIEGLLVGNDISSSYNIMRKAMKCGLGGFPHEQLHQEVIPEIFNGRGIEGVVVRPVRITPN